MCVCVCVQGYSPQHHRFNASGVPGHITYAYKKSATIAENNDFYPLPQNQTRKVDVLFLIASAPVKTGSLPEAGSEAYVGLAIAMELAMNELSEKFPAFFGEGKSKPNGWVMQINVKQTRTKPQQKAYIATTAYPTDIDV